MKTIIIDISSILFYGGLFYIMQLLIIVLMSKLRHEKIFELKNLNPFRYSIEANGPWLVLTFINIVVYLIILIIIEKIQTYNWIIQF